MLISSDLSTLGAALKSSSPAMVSKGVESVRVPVSTINAHRRADVQRITHAAFVSAVASEFAATYGPSPVVSVDERILHPGSPRPGEPALGEKGRQMVLDGMAELASWDWAYGQTPAFTNTLRAELSIGPVRADIESRHGRVTALALELERDGGEGAEADDAQDALDRIAACAKGLPYETLDGIGTFLGDSVRPDLSWEVVAWLQSHM